MNTYIFYYSGTGNSLFAAKKLSENIAESSVIPMIGASEQDLNLKEADAIGFVFPVYAFSLPGVVEKFVHKIQLQSDAYVFAVATRGGSSCKVFDHLEKILKKKGNSLHSRFFLNMPNNYLTMFPIPSTNEVEDLTKKATNELEKMAEIITGIRPAFIAWRAFIIALLRPSS